MGSQQMAPLGIPAIFKRDSCALSIGLPACARKPIETDFVAGHVAARRERRGHGTDPFISWHNVFDLIDDAGLVTLLGASLKGVVGASVEIELECFAIPLTHGAVDVAKPCLRSNCPCTTWSEF
jgi:hypothetical protein